MTQSDPMPLLQNLLPPKFKLLKGVPDAFILGLSSMVRDFLLPAGNHKRPAAAGCRVFLLAHCDVKRKTAPPPPVPKLASTGVKGAE